MHKLFQKIKEKGKIPNSSHESSIILTKIVKGH